ncbi:MAG: LTA synthase family protein [Bacteroidia bacterium]
MKIIQTILIVFLECAGLQAMAEKPAGPDLRVKQEVRYTCEGAREVFLVWNVNAGQVADSASRPAGTVLKAGWLYTPMRLESNVFSAVLLLKKNTLVGYKFWITKGLRDQATDIWDGGNPADSASSQDLRHSLCLQDNIVLVESHLSAKPSVQLSILDFSGRILAGALVLLAVAFLIRRKWYRLEGLKPAPHTIIIGSALVLFILLLLARASVMKLGWDLYLHPVDTMPMVYRGSFYDVLYILVLVMIFVPLLFIFRKQESTQYALSYSFAALALVSGIAGLLNIRLAELQYTPYNFHRLYYSEFLDQSFKKKEIAASFTSVYLADMLMIGVAAVILMLLFGFFAARFLTRSRMPRLGFSLLCCIGIGYLFADKTEVRNPAIAYDRLANPVTEFVCSMNPFTEHPQLFTMEVPDSLKKFPRQAESTLAMRYAELPKKIKNVLVVVMGSVGSAYTAPYDSIYKATPQLAACLEHAIVFRNMYAQEPSSENSLLSLLTSVHPWLSTGNFVADYPELDLPSLSSELKRKGYRTGFFNSANTKENGIEAFLQHRDLEVIKDNKQISCKQNCSDKKNSDLCTERELISWLRIAPANPFFAIIATKQTEQPFCFQGEAKPYRTKDTLLSHYLNALSATDAMIGKLIEDLKHNRLFESTLLVLVGDKGTTFATAQGMQEDGALREENVHVPCLFVNPFLKPESIRAAGSLSDLAPTIMNVLGYEGSPVWQGSSLLADAPEHRVYFFSPLNGYTFGYREGERKYTYNAAANATEIYDLSVDPYETNNLAEQEPEAASACHLRLAAWVQRQKAFMDARTMRPALLAAAR